MGKGFFIYLVVIDMVTKEQALEIYNEYNNTNYLSVVELGHALVKHVLSAAWVESKKRDAALLADNEELV